MNDRNVTEQKHLGGFEGARRPLQGNPQGRGKLCPSGAFAKGESEPEAR